MKGHQAGMDPQGDRGQMEIVEEHGQVVVKATARMEIQLQDTRGGERQTGAGCLVTEPQLQTQRELRPLDAVL